MNGQQDGHLSCSKFCSNNTQYVTMVAESYRMLYIPYSSQIQFVLRYLLPGWLHGTVGRTSVSTGELSLSYARPTVDG